MQEPNAVDDRAVSRKLALLVQEMRQAQKDFFSARGSGRDSSKHLTDAKRFERAVDSALKQILGGDAAKLPGFGWGEDRDESQG